MTERIKVLWHDGKEYLTDTMDCLAEVVADDGPPTNFAHEREIVRAM